MTTRRIEIETEDQFIAEVVAAPAEDDVALFLRANVTANRLAREFRRPSGDFKLRVPSDLRVPTAGGRTRTAADLGLRLLSVPVCDDCDGSGLVDDPDPELSGTTCHACSGTGARVV